LQGETIAESLEQERDEEVLPKTVSLESLEGLMDEFEFSDHEQLAVLWFSLENYTVRSQNENEKKGRENNMWQEYSGHLSTFTAVFRGRSRIKRITESGSNLEKPYPISPVTSSRDFEV